MFWTFARFSPAPVGLSPRSQLPGTQGPRLYTTAQVWVPGGLRVACSGRSKSRNLASDRGVAFRGARARAKQWKNPHFFSDIFRSELSGAAVTLSLQRLRTPTLWKATVQQRNSSGAPAPALETLALVKATVLLCLEDGQCPPWDYHC